MWGKKDESPREAASVFHRSGEARFLLFFLSVEITHAFLHLCSCVHGVQRCGGGGQGLWPGPAPAAPRPSRAQHPQHAHSEGWLAGAAQTRRTPGAHPWSGSLLAACSQAVVVTSACREQGGSRRCFIALANCSKGVGSRGALIPSSLSHSVFL